MKQLKPSKRKSKRSKLENGSDAYFEAVLEKIRTANFIHPISLPERLNTKLKTYISTCEV